MLNSLFSSMTLVLGLVFYGACSGGHVFSKKTLREEYESKVAREGTVEGRAWLAAGDQALQNPQAIPIPYRHQGRFPSARPRALGLSFIAKRGQKIVFDIQRDSGSAVTLYADIFKKVDSLNNKHLQAGDTSLRELVFTAEDSGEYLLRLQPELNQEGEYLLTVSAQPSLGFPVSGKVGRIGSFWGADRDAGKRRHEGIDIFAPKRTPAIAAADGYVSHVGDGGIGGKTVWVRATGRSVNLYYAHLDSQMVSSGDRVRVGDTVGLIGNTGNARFTPPHLHFGIYTFGGAVDPFPFVNRNVIEPPELQERELPALLSLKRPAKKLLGSDTIPENTILVPLAYNAKGYICELPNGKIVQTPFRQVRPIRDTLTSSTIKAVKTIGYSQQHNSPPARAKS